MEQRRQEVLLHQAAQGCMHLVVRLLSLLVASWQDGRCLQGGGGAWHATGAGIHQCVSHCTFGGPAGGGKAVCIGLLLRSNVAAPVPEACICAPGRVGDARQQPTAAATATAAALLSSSICWAAVTAAATAAASKDVAAAAAAAAGAASSSNSHSRYRCQHMWQAAVHNNQCVWRSAGLVCLLDVKSCWVSPAGAGCCSHSAPVVWPSPLWEGCDVWIQPDGV
jgi:hypothetical protein